MDPASNKQMGNKPTGTAAAKSGEKIGVGMGEHMENREEAGKANSEGLWRKIVDDISKKFLDLTWAQKSFDYENLVEKSKVYKNEFRKQLNDTFSYVSSFMKLAKGDASNLEREREEEGERQKDIQMLMLMDDSLREIADIITNKGNKMYPKLGFTKEFTSM